jgi:hypothetical protein
MKKILNYLLFLAFSGVIFTACNDDDDDTDINLYDNDVTGFYFINYGGSSVGYSTITKYDYETDSVTNNYFEAKNGFEITSNVQYSYKYEDNIYMLGNDVDQVVVVDTAFIQTFEGVSDGIATPRFCVASGDYLYISCWGEDPDWSVMPDSYIAKYNISNNEVEDTISLPGGPEGLAIANGKLYAALNFSYNVAVIDLDDNSVSYIETPAVTSYFIKDDSDNLYVSLVSSYTYYSASSGLGYINTSDNTLEATFYLDGVSSGYCSIMTSNANCSTIYMLASSWVEQADESWTQEGSIYSFDTSTESFSPFIEGLSGTNGIAFNSVTDNVYVFGGESYTEPGTVAVYDVDGTYESEFSCGISPYWAIELNYDEL